MRSAYYLFNHLNIIRQDLKKYQLSEGKTQNLSGAGDAGRHDASQIITVSSHRPSQTLLGFLFFRKSIQPTDTNVCLKCVNTH